MIHTLQLWKNEDVVEACICQLTARDTPIALVTITCSQIKYLGRWRPSFSLLNCRNGVNKVEFAKTVSLKSFCAGRGLV